MWDHNGTYMDGIGFRHMHHEVIAELAADDSLEGESSPSLHTSSTSSAASLLHASGDALPLQVLKNLCVF